MTSALKEQEAHAARTEQGREDGGSVLHFNRITVSALLGTDFEKVKVEMVRSVRNLLKRSGQDITGLDKHSGSGSSWTAHILQRDLTGFANRLDMGHKKTVMSRMAPKLSF